MADAARDQTNEHLAGLRLAQLDGADRERGSKLFEDQRALISIRADPSGLEPDATRARSCSMVTVVIATPLEEALVERLRAVDDRLDVRFESDLLPPPRYPSDHVGDP